MYNLKTTSSTARFYTWVWGTNVSEFKTMCPYFWKYVLTILFLPVILVGKFLFYIMPAKKKVGKGLDYVAESKVGRATGTVFYAVTDQPRFWDGVGKVLKWIFFIGVGLFALLIIIGICIGFWENPTGGLAVVGGLVLAIGALAGVIYVFDEYSLGRKIGAPFRLFGNMISSLYHNMCPLIKWQ